jgi:hypothetical protein
LKGGPPSDCCEPKLYTDVLQEIPKCNTGYQKFNDIYKALDLTIDPNNYKVVSGTNDMSYYQSGYLIPINSDGVNVPQLVPLCVPQTCGNVQMNAEADLDCQDPADLIFYKPYDLSDLSLQGFQNQCCIKRENIENQDLLMNDWQFNIYKDYYQQLIGEPTGTPYQLTETSSGSYFVEPKDSAGETCDLNDIHASLPVDYLTNFLPQDKIISLFDGLDLTPSSISNQELRDNPTNICMWRGAMDGEIVCEEHTFDSCPSPTCYPQGDICNSYSPGRGAGTHSISDGENRNGLPLVYEFYDKADNVKSLEGKYVKSSSPSGDITCVNKKPRLNGCEVKYQKYLNADSSPPQYFYNNEILVNNEFKSCSFPIKYEGQGDINTAQNES